MAVAAEGITEAVTCKVVITLIKAEGVVAWATNNLVAGAEVDINMEDSTALKAIMVVDTMGNLTVAAEILCSPTCLSLIKIKKATSTEVTRTSNFSIRAQTFHRTLLRWAWAGHREVAPIRQLLVGASLSSNRA